MNQELFDVRIYGLPGYTDDNSYPNIRFIRISEYLFLFMSHYLVTGGAGFIGTNLVKQLLASGHQVRVLDNYSAGRFANRIQPEAEYVEGDIRNMTDLEKAMKGIDGVFHMAAVPRVPYSAEHPQ